MSEAAGELDLIAARLDKINKMPKGSYASAEAAYVAAMRDAADMLRDRAIELVKSTQNA